MKFLVTRIGCGIAGFKDEEIAPLFRKAVSVSNIYLPQKFYDILLEPNLKHCFYYGKNVPAALMWMKKKTGIPFAKEQVGLADSAAARRTVQKRYTGLTHLRKLITVRLHCI